MPGYVSTSCARLDEFQSANFENAQREPHSDLDAHGESLENLDLAQWASTLQKVTYAIRDAGAVSQTILVSGTNYLDASTFPKDSGTALQAIHNRDGGHRDIVFELHHDLQGISGSSCERDSSTNIKETGDYLRFIGRRAFIGELTVDVEHDGGKTLLAVLDSLVEYSDVFIGWAIRNISRSPSVSGSSADSESEEDFIGGSKFDASPTILLSSGDHVVLRWHA